MCVHLCPHVCVWRVCAAIIEMHRNTAARMCAFLSEAKFSARCPSTRLPLISLLGDKPLIRICLRDPARHAFIHVCVTLCVCVSICAHALEFSAPQCVYWKCVCACVFAQSKGINLRLIHIVLLS